MSTNTNITYSPVPAIQALFASNDLTPSRLESLSEGLLRAQMNLSRAIMYTEDGLAVCPYQKEIREVMSVIADVYDTFENIEKARKKYDSLMQTMEK